MLDVSLNLCLACRRISLLDQFQWKTEPKLSIKKNIAQVTDHNRGNYVGTSAKGPNSSQRILAARVMFRGIEGDDAGVSYDGMCEGTFEADPPSFRVRRVCIGGCAGVREWEARCGVVFLWCFSPMAALAFLAKWENCGREERFAHWIIASRRSHVSSLSVKQPSRTSLHTDKSRRSKDPPKSQPQSGLSLSLSLLLLPSGSTRLPLLRRGRRRRRLARERAARGAAAAAARRRHAVAAAGARPDAHAGAGDHGAGDDGESGDEDDSAHGEAHGCLGELWNSFVFWRGHPMYEWIGSDWVLYSKITQLPSHLISSTLDF